MKIFALILSGGQSDGVDKGLCPWQGKTLIDCVIDRIKPQVDHIAISANRNLESYALRARTCCRMQGNGGIWADWLHYVPLPMICRLPLPTGFWLYRAICLIYLMIW